MVRIDGSKGEGGGQVLRTSLALSLVTGTPFQMVNIRAGRPKPGLMRQHLTAVKAAAEVGAAEVAGAELGSRELTFQPRSAEAGRLPLRGGDGGERDAGAADGAAGAADARAGRPRWCWRAGRTTRLAPPFDFLEKAYLPLRAADGAERGGDAGAARLLPGGRREVPGEAWSPRR